MATSSSEDWFHGGGIYSGDSNTSEDGICGADSDSDSSEEQYLYDLRYLFERARAHAARNHPQQPPSLCQSIGDFFKKWLCCGRCIGGFDNEHQQPGDNPVAEPPCLPIWKLFLNFFRRNGENED